MDDLTIQQIKQIDDVKEFIDLIAPFYPGINIKEFKIIEIEQALFHVLIMLLGKILHYSPEGMKQFLRDYLLKFEISNLKQIILGIITGMNYKQISSRVNFLVEEYLEHTEFIKNLMEITSLDEIQFYLRTSRYNQAVREGLLYYRNNKEIFVLESFLDKLYYDNLIAENKIYHKKEKEMINLFNSSLIEIYNLRIIERGIKNNIEIKLLTQFLVDNSLFLTKEKTNQLLKIRNLNEFYDNIENFLGDCKELKKLFIPVQINRRHFIWSLGGIYQTYYFKTFKFKNDDIDYATIYRILELIIKKDREIKFVIMPNAIRIIHERYERLDNGNL